MVHTIIGTLFFLFFSPWTSNKLWVSGPFETARTSVATYNDVISSYDCSRWGSNAEIKSLPYIIL